MEVSEGAVVVEVPEQPDHGAGDVVFFNPKQELNRDVTVAALRAHRESDHGRGRTYLDATAASGVRGVRAAAEGWEVTCTDIDPEAVELARANLARNDLDGEVARRNANAHMHEARYDVVDVDPFGTAIPFADAAFNSATELVCVTATDTAPLCGAHFQSGVRKYGAIPRNTDYHAEMGLRILLSALARTAARYDVGVTPVLSHATRHYVRTYLRVSGRATDANAALDELGYLYHCPECLYREHDPGLVADPLDDCPNCGGEQVLTAGPVWLGRAHDPAFVAATRAHVTEEMGTAKRARRLLDALEGELDVPTHYDQHVLSKRWGISAIGMDEFLERLHDAGHEASRSHFGGTTVKTTADVEEIRRATT
ncbi:tRNA (guanine(26)-N(2))-dimethyltransferase [Halomarina ordinaria]|uniref:tRNA (guanine(26)-N(2))-dimethyltransferase n=1 Tax=Halomarina ordinaria TaxID=3033939 RepID=A0ABD5UAE1_9EURY|nr:tRNA (guanine(26)-N(2))-dimethyltransferase [Halomarina sp. PSRA2]